MKQKKKKVWLLLTMGFVLMCAGIYLGLSVYYSQCFCYGTWINNTYVTGKSVEEVNQELLKESVYDTLIVIDRNDKRYEIKTADIDYQMDFTSALYRIRQEQNPYLWITYFMEHKMHVIEPEVTFSEEKLRVLLEQADFMQEDIIHPDNKVEIIKTTEGYILEDNTVNQLVPERAVKAVCNGLSEMEKEVYLELSGCYDNLPVTTQSRDMYKLWNKVFAFQEFEMTYVMGDREEVIDATVVSEWIAVDAENGGFLTDEKGHLILDETKVMEYVVSLGEKYDTLGKPRDFQSTRGDIIHLEGGTYGNDIDEDAECALLIEDFYADRDGQKREPVYASRAWSQGEDDIGGTYVEVDMTEQTLYYYVDYEIVLETPVVTGNMRRGWDTPAVVCYVYGKARNRTLRGANYATFVYYWMPVYGNIGFHDATWRRKFGEDIYMTDGSHGCINMPKDMAAELYNMIEIGTPVIMFY